MTVMIFTVRVPLEPFFYGGGCDGPLTVFVLLGEGSSAPPRLSLLPGGSWWVELHHHLNQLVADIRLTCPASPPLQTSVDLC